MSQFWSKWDKIITPDTFIILKSKEIYSCYFLTILTQSGQLPPPPLLRENQMVLKLVVYLSVIYSRISPSFFLVHLLLILGHFCLVDNVIGTFSSRCFELYRKCIVFYQRCDYSLKKGVSTVQKTVKSSGTFLLT